MAEAKVFSSIKWKFILVYFLLVFIAMVIVGVFIVGKLEAQQVDNITSTMDKHIQNIIESSSYIGEDNWDGIKEDLQETIKDWVSDSNEVLYIIHNEDIPTIIASSSKDQEKIVGANALSNKNIEPKLLLEAYKGIKNNVVVKDYNEDTIVNHLAYPVYTSYGRVKGVIYMTMDLKNVLVTVNESKIILTNATIIGLLITISLGFLIASSITEPIRDVTKKAEKMAKGDFEQFVEVKSDDEIGQLANMFNHLTSKLKDTIEEMDLEKSKLDTIFNYMAEGVLAIDRMGNVIHANPIAMEILENRLRDEGLESYDEISLGYLNLEDLDYGKPESLEGDRLLEAGREVYKLKYAPFKNEVGNIGGVILVFQNMTNEHRLDKMRKEFVANVSHELKTPITTIKSYTETLMDLPVDQETEKKFLKIIDDECDRMTRLVRDLLQLSNLDYEKTKWVKEYISINMIIKDSLEKLDLAFKEKNQDLLVDLDENIGKLYIDRDGIEQVFLNILSNANKYTGEGGRIEVKSSLTESGVLISIKDNGKGIPVKDKERIFERFYRVEKGRSRNLGGTGLGLAIAREIISAHQGTITMESELGQGTLVRIKLPYIGNITEV